VGAFRFRIEVKDVPLRTCLALILVQSWVKYENGAGDGLDCRIIDGLLIIGQARWVGRLSIPEGGFGGNPAGGGQRTGGMGMM
jgi:hypothetical protein